VSESPETTPLSAAEEQAIRRNVAEMAKAEWGDNPGTAYHPEEQCKSERQLVRLLEAFDAAHATVPAGPEDPFLRTDAELAAFQRGMAYQAARPVPAAETCYCHDHPKGHPMTDHAEWARSTGASDEDRERRVHEAIERIVENELTGVPRWRFDLTRRLARAALDAGAGVSPSTGWKPATAKGTAIGEDEWGRPLHVWTGSPSTGDPERTYAWRPDYGPDGLPETALPERVVVAENGAYWRDYGSHYSMCPVSDDNDPVAVRAVYTPSTGDDRLREAAQALSEALWSNEDRSLTQPAERHALDALRAALGEENA
jgi:hypothetical protein